MNIDNAVDTGFWIREGFVWGPIHSGRFEVTPDGRIPINTGNYTFTKDGRILDPAQQETGFFVRRDLHIYGPLYGKLPWMTDGAKNPKMLADSPARYGMDPRLVRD